MEEKKKRTKLFNISEKAELSEVQSPTDEIVKVIDHKSDSNSRKLDKTKLNQKSPISGSKDNLEGWKNSMTVS